MPTPSLDLMERSNQVAPLLLAIGVGSGLSPKLMRSRLLARMPTATPQSLKRNWNRWLSCAKTGKSIPTLSKLVAVARAAKDLGWLDGAMSADARGLAAWLLGQERLQRAEAQAAASQLLTAFLNKLLGEVDFLEYDVEEALESFFSTFASGVARHVLRASTPGTQGLSEGVRNGTEKALSAVSALLVELADAVEQNEFAPVAPAEAEEVFEPPSDAAELIARQEAAEPTRARLKLTGRKH